MAGRSLGYKDKLIQNRNRKRRQCQGRTFTSINEARYDENKWRTAAATREKIYYEKKRIETVMKMWVYFPAYQM